jgi:hypothetical protein
MGKLLTYLPRLTLAHNCGRRSGQLQVVRAAETFNVSHRLMGDTFGSLFAGRRCPCRGWHSVHLIVHHQWEHSCQSARSCSTVPIAPMGKMLTRLPRLSLAQLRLTLRSTTVCTCRRGLNFSHRPDGNIADVLMPRLFLQTTLWSTTQNVRVKVTFKGSHRPDGKITDVLASTLARTTAAHTLVNYSLMYVPQRPVFSHRPDGKVADVLAPTHACQTANTSVSIM